MLSRYVIVFSCPVSGSLDFTIKVWNPALKSLVYSLKPHSDKITCLCTSGVNGELISGSLDKTIMFWK